MSESAEQAEAARGLAGPEIAPVLWRYFRGYKAPAALAIVTSAIYAFSTVLLLGLFRSILSDVLLADGEDLSGFAGLAAGEDTGAESGIDLEATIEHFLAGLQAWVGVDAENVVWKLPLIFVVVFLIRSLAMFANGYLFQIIGQGAANDLRNDLYERILYQSSRFYARHPTGELVSRVANDVSVLQSAVSTRLLDLFQQSLTLVLLVWYLLSIHLELALLCLVAVPAILIPIVRFGRGMRRTTHRSQERLAEVSNLVAEAVRGHRVVKAFTMEGFELERFRQATRRHLRMRLRAQLLSYASSPVVESMAAIGAAVFLVYAGRAVRAEELTPSIVVQFLTNLLLLYDPVRKLNKVNLILQEALAAAQRILGVMRVPNEIEERPGAPRVDHFSDRIRFENVSFAYDEAPVLRDVELTIPRGQVVALVGPSGAGKSTLVNLLPRFFDPTHGRITLDGTDIRDVELQSLRRLIGLVTQETVLFDDTVRNNIAYGRHDLPLEAVRAAARAAYAEEFIEASPQGYETLIGEGGLKLSGGQRQRLAIARALLKDPPILILDEATSHLDSESETLVQKALSNLMTGRTALVIAHRLATVRRADRIVVMESGRIVETGKHAELAERGGVYQRLVELELREA